MNVDLERRLPPEILAKAIKSGCDWRRSDIPSVIDAAQQAGLAVLGGQMQFVFSDGICELYWQNYDLRDRDPGEAWPEYVARTTGECLAQFNRLIDTTDLVADARAQF